MVVHIATRLQSGISIYQSTWRKYSHICSQTLLNFIFDISLVKCHLVHVCYRLSALKCGDDQFDPSLSILCMMSSAFTTSIYWKYHFALTPINIWTTSLVVVLMLKTPFNLKWRKYIEYCAPILDLVVKRKIKSWAFLCVKNQPRCN